MTKILLIDLAFHGKTASSDFFKDILRSIGELTARSEPMNPTAEEMVDLSDALDYDLVVCWQCLTPAIALAKMGVKNLVWVPMFDSNVREHNLNALKNIKTLCFSAVLYYQLQKDGFKRCFYARYFPKLSDKRVSFERGILPFFWQRSDLPSWRSVITNLAKTNYQELNVHWSPDEPDKIKVPPPSHIEKLKHRIRVTTWFNNREEADDNLRQSNIYFAPRILEGIGLSFLDAMAVGMPVVAFDASTMNEYIVHGWNGVLMEPVEAGQPMGGLDLQTLKKMSDNTVETVMRGREQWLSDEEGIKQWLI